MICSIVGVKIGNDETNVGKFPRNLSKENKNTENKNFVFLNGHHTTSSSQRIIHPRMDYSRASKQQNQGSFDPSSGEIGKPHPTRPTVSRTNRSNSPLGELDAPHPTHPTASWTHHIQLAQRRVGSTESDSPLGELDDPFPTRPTTSWISLI